MDNPVHPNPALGIVCQVSAGQTKVREYKAYGKTPRWTKIVAQ